MGYSITIGCAEIQTEWDTGYADPPVARWIVPTIGEFGGDDVSDGGTCNERSPSYTSWSAFTRATGLESVFFDKENGLMREHPGCQRLTQDHLALFVSALVNYRKAHPKERAGLCTCRACCPYFDKEHNAPAHDPTLNYNLQRLEWLVRWTRYALSTERPAIENT